MRLGFIGFGTMGKPMAEHLLRAGNELFVWSRRAASADLLMAEASRIGVALPVSAAVWQQLDALMGLGRGQDDTSSLLRVLETGARQRRGR